MWILNIKRGRAKGGTGKDFRVPLASTLFYFIRINFKKDFSVTMSGELGNQEQDHNRLRQEVIQAQGNPREV